MVSALRKATARDGFIRCSPRFVSSLKGLGCSRTGPRSRNYLFRIPATDPEPKEGSHGGEERKVAMDIIRQQKEVNDQLAKIQAQVEALNPEEKEQLAELMKSSSLEPGTTSPSDEKKEDANSEVKGAEAGEDASEDGMSDEGFVEIPLEIRRMLRDAGVEGAMEWDGNPAKEPLRDYVEERLKNEDAQSDKNISNESEGPPESIEDVDDEFIEGDDEEFEPGKGVAEMIGKLESGEPLGKDPRYEGLNPESYEAFQKRMLKYQQAYEAQYLDRKDWKISLEDYKEIVNLTINEDHPPWKRPEITKVQPAPDWPDPLLQKQFDRAQWIMFLLRKTYLRPDPNCPSLVLHETGLLSEDLIFEDPFVESVGPESWIDYTTRLTKAGGIVEIGHIWSERGIEKPYPKWIIWVDLWLSIPYPIWYHDYIEMHSQFDDPPNLSRESDESSYRDPFAPEPNFWSPPPLRYPKGKISLKDILKENKKDNSAPLMGNQKPKKKGAQPQEEVTRTYSSARVEEHANERGYESPIPSNPPKSFKEVHSERKQAENERLSRLQECLNIFATDRSQPQNDKKFAHKTDKEEYKYLEVLRTCIAEADRLDRGPDSSVHSESQQLFSGFQHVEIGGDSKPKRSRRLVNHQVEYSDSQDKSIPWSPFLGAVSNTLQEEIVFKAAGLRLQSSKRIEIEQGKPKNSQYLVLSYADERQRKAFELPTLEEYPEFPECPDPGQAWRSGQYFSIPMTIGHKIDNEIGQVKSIHCDWGAIIGHSIGTQQDLLDVYARQLQLWESHDPTFQRIKIARRQCSNSV